jgi:hypothetical protein
MRKAELNNEQASARSYVTETLLAAGWRPSLNHELVEEGLWMPYEATLEFTNDKAVHLRVEYSASEKVVRLKIATTDGEQIQLVTQAGEGLRDFVRVLIEIQSLIAPNSVSIHLKPILQAFPETYVELDENDGLAKLVP